MRVALVAGMPAPYRLPVWDALAGRVDELHVLLCSASESNRVWRVSDTSSARYRSVVLPGVHRHIGALDWGFHWNPTLLGELKRIRPDAVLLSGYDTPSYLAAFAYARANRIPAVLSIESHGLSSRVRRGPIALARRRIVQAADACVAHGRAGAAYLRQLGAREDRIVTGILAVDVERFGGIADAMPLTAHRKGAGKVRFVYVGQLIARKGVIELMQAFAKLPAEHAELVIVGHGPLEQEVQRRIAETGAGNVQYLGATTTVEETARIYADCDVFVMPSLREVWGLVLNEALAAGLYSLSSKYAGATPDLVEDAPEGIGQVFDPADPADFEQSLRRALQTVRSGRNDRPRIAAWGRRHTPERLADAYHRALMLALAPELQLR